MAEDLKTRLVASFRWRDPGPQSTHLVSDISGWWRDAGILAALGPALAGLFPGSSPTVIVAPEVTGFLLGPLVATATGAGFVEAYKDSRPRRTPDRLIWGTSRPDYRGRTLRLGLRAAPLGPTDRVLLVDDWVVTGAQLAALRDAIGQAGATVVGAAVIVDESDDPIRSHLGVRGLLRGTDL